MTIDYGTNFFSALFRWRGSVWKSVWKELLLWLLFYYALRFILIYAIPINYKESVKVVIDLFDSYTKRIPLEFLLGFYVSQVVSRWWSQNMALSMPSDLMAMITAYVHETDEESRCLRHMCARHIVLAFVLSYRRVSSRLRQMFPDTHKFVDVGLVTHEEEQVLKHAYPDTLYEIPFQWIQENVRAKVGNQLAILNCMNTHRGQYAALVKFNNISVPLVYTQTVTVAVYGYFVFCLIGHQFYYAEADTFFPFLTILRFLFGIGWLKVAEDLAKPFGDDDDDTNLCLILQSYVRMVFTIADYAPMTRPQSVDKSGVSVGYIDEQSVQFHVDRFLSMFDAEINVQVKRNNKLSEDICKFLSCKT